MRICKLTLIRLIVLKEEKFVNKVNNVLIDLELTLIKTRIQSALIHKNIIFM
jgi:hypothetical protein